MTKAQLESKALIMVTRIDNGMEILYGNSIKFPLFAVLVAIVDKI